LYDDFKNKLKEHCALFQKYGVEHLSLGVYDCNNEEQTKISTENVTIFRKNVYKFWNASVDK
jgi:coproporphyrinogen III oxidase-like Fe-S oxidoreductase